MNNKEQVKKSLDENKRSYLRNQFSQSQEEHEKTFRLDEMNKKPMKELKITKDMI